MDRSLLFTKRKICRGANPGVKKDPKKYYRYLDVRSRLNRRLFRMHILYVARRFSPDVKGGGEISALNIAKTMVIRGHDVQVLTTREDGPGSYQINGVKVNYIPFDGRFRKRFTGEFYEDAVLNFKLYREMRNNMDLSQIDIIHALNMSTLPAVAMIGMHHSPPTIATVNSSWLMCFTYDQLTLEKEVCTFCSWTRLMQCSLFKGRDVNFGRRGLRALRGLYGIAVMRCRRFFADRMPILITVSRFMKRQLISFGYDPRRIIVINDPLDLQRPDTERVTEIQRQLNLGDDDVSVILYAGRLVPEKGVQFLVRAMNTVVKRLPNAHLLLVGRGYYKKRLRDISRRLNIHQNVHFIGFVDHYTVLHYIKLADVCVSPTIIGEPLGLFLAEGAIYGKPLIATYVGNNPENVRSGYNGLIIPPRDHKVLASALIKILTSQAKLSLTDAQQEIQKKFSSQKVTSKYLKLYNFLIDRV